MNKTLVLYTSNYGSTKQYAEWIGRRINADIYPTSMIKTIDIAIYDSIIIGGGLYAVGILGLKTLKPYIECLKNKKVIVFTVGLSYESDTVINHIKTNNLEKYKIPYNHFFYLRGAFDFDKLALKHKIMMRALATKVKQKDGKLSTEEQGILNCMMEPIDAVSIDQITPLLKALKKG
ncbi:MAG: flavodoxin domain-containing protein [Bacillota bacterium]